MALGFKLDKKELGEGGDNGKLRAKAYGTFRVCGSIPIGAKRKQAVKKDHPVG